MAACALHARGRRLPFGIEVVAFAEEEGQRYKATFLGSGALTGDFDPAWLDQTDADGVRMRHAMRAAGLPATLGAIPALKRDPARYLGFVEVHIEQGPVLNELDLPLGVVTSINGSVRYLGEVIGHGQPCRHHADGPRRDAACGGGRTGAVPERRGRGGARRGGHGGPAAGAGGSINVVPGRCRFSLDLRATTDAARDACAADVLAEAGRICERRGVRCTWSRRCSRRRAQRTSLAARWEAAVQRWACRCTACPAAPATTR
jgi:N-carbamoyl-L-amino-acid hydrolase